VSKGSGSKLAKVRPGSTLRVEIHLSNFCAYTSALTCADVGLLQHLLVLEAVGDPLPQITKPCVQRAFDRREDYRRIKGGFGRRRLSTKVRLAVYQRDQGRCAYCSNPVNWPQYHCDHVEPVAKGGSDDIDNLCVACVPCNLAKAAKSLSDWLAR
jgi:hypothetical protein